MESERDTGDSGSPCWVPLQNLITEYPLKKHVADCTPIVSAYELQGIIQKFSPAINVILSIWKRFQSQFLR